MQFVQLLLTTEQAALIAYALDEDRDPGYRDEVIQLQGLFTGIAAEPSKFAPRGEMARTVKQIIRRVKGPAQPKSVAPKRKRSQGQQKRDRAARKAFVAEWNAAVQRIEQERAELAEAEV